MIYGMSVPIRNPQSFQIETKAHHLSNSLEEGKRNASPITLVTNVFNDNIQRMKSNNTPYEGLISTNQNDQKLGV